MQVEPNRVRTRRNTSGAGNKAEISSGGLNVAADLFAECFGRGPRAFVAEAGKEDEAEGRGLFERDRAKVEQVGFDGEGGVREGGAGADVRDGVEADIVYKHASCVDACGRDEPFVIS